MTVAGPRHATLVLAAATGVNLALGVLYAWSIFKAAILKSVQAGGDGAFGWNPASVNDPYALAVLVFAGTMTVAGRVQDRFGARMAAMLSGALVGAGFLVCASTTSYAGWLFGFGGMVGAGIAFGYAAATPAALRWYAPAKTGQIAGIVVSGFGLAAVYIAPLSKFLLGTVGLSATLYILGGAFLVALIGLAQFLVPPPVGHVAVGAPTQPPVTSAPDASAPPTRGNDLPPAKVLRSPVFWLMWVIYGAGAGAGLMVIGSMAGMAQSGLGEKAFLAVAILAIGNAAGRIVAGWLSDRIGRRHTLALASGAQAALMYASVPAIGLGFGPAVIVPLAAAIGFNYGANLALFPAMSKDMWGMKHLGTNYGFLFTSWGVGGFVLTRIAETLRANTGEFSDAFVMAGTILLISTLLVFLLEDDRSKT